MKVPERMWSPTEIELILRHYPVKGSRWLAERLHRSVDSVTSLAPQARFAIPPHRSHPRRDRSSTSRARRGFSFRKVSLSPVVRSVPNSSLACSFKTGTGSVPFVGSISAASTPRARASRSIRSIPGRRVRVLQLGHVGRGDIGLLGQVGLRHPAGGIAVPSVSRRTAGQSPDASWNAESA